MSQHPGQRLRPTLRHWRDWQSVFYMIILPLIVWWQWSHGLNLILYGIELFLTLGVGVIHHNHTHVRMWWGRW
ncbi:MAG: fatty acid desaturase, partial [Comamonas sp.]